MAAVSGKPGQQRPARPSRSGDRFQPEVDPLEKASACERAARHDLAQAREDSGHNAIGVLGVPGLSRRDGAAAERIRGTSNAEVSCDLRPGTFLFRATIRIQRAPPAYA